MFYQLIRHTKQQPVQQLLLMPTTHHGNMATVVTTCMQEEDFTLGWRVHHYIRQLGTRIDAVLSNALIDM
ncbi:hypothetical protein E2562_029872 [Oryza meyeriana var. granulata]|uniref:Uncharacterized protein n=1 Tax=Oryza meyeriana var. granulata TaxID=110450 RepID=A0A6G1ERA2_9ORYZ|nr:hypothetical protein E2562_029872 [Oryza meyeriana var. granulata]